MGYGYYIYCNVKVIITALLLYLVVCTNDLSFLLLLLSTGRKNYFVHSLQCV